MMVRRQGKEFFEKIYIDREVVQEASVWYYIKWTGERNEPFNSVLGSGIFPFPFTFEHKVVL